MDSDFPVIQIIYQATGSKAAACMLGALLVFLLFFSTVTTTASASRQIFAFSRDQVSTVLNEEGVPHRADSALQGFPFSEWIRYVPPRWEIPVNAIIICLGVSAIISAINFGSSAGFEAVVGVSNAALGFSYIISVGCIRLKRLRGEPLLPARWSLGKWGGLINDCSLAFLAVIFVFAFSPTDVIHGAHEFQDKFNWAVVMFSATCMLAVVYYALGGRHKYVSPVSLVKQE